MKWRNRLGFTLIEVLVVSMIIGIMLPPLGAAFYNFVKVPPEETDELTVINEVRQVAEWLVEDGTKATYYQSGEFWQVDYSTGILPQLVSGYTWLEDAGTLIRYTWVNPADPSSEEVSVNIARHITAFTIEPHPTYLKAYIESTIDGIGGETVDSGTVFVFPRAKSYQATSYAILCGNELNIHGNTKTIIGGVHSGGTVTVTGGNNAIIGTLYTQSDDELNCKNNPDFCDDVQWMGSVEFPPIWDIRQFMPPPEGINPNLVLGENYFYSAAKIDLDRSEWHLDETTIRPGIYVSDTAIELRSDMSGKVTLIAPAIKITSTGINLSSYYASMLLWATGPDIIGAPGQAAIEISANGGYFEGILYAPYGTASISAQGGTVISGSIIALNVDISGSLWLISTSGL